MSAGEKTTLRPLSVLFSQDMRLAQTRHWVLEQAGLYMITVQTLADLYAVAESNSVAFFLLCNTLSVELRAEASQQILDRWKDAKLLILVPSYPSPEDPANEFFPTLEGPERLVSTVAAFSTLHRNFNQPDKPILRSFAMFCSTGLDLYEQYQTAEKERDAFNARKAASGRDGGVLPKELHQAKQRYVLHFANWLSHKAFCQDCKPKAPSKGSQRSVEPGR